MNGGSGVIDHLMFPVFAFVAPARRRICGNMMISTGSAAHRIVAHLAHIEGNAKESAKELTVFNGAFVVFGDYLMVGNQTLSPEHADSTQVLRNY